MKLVLFVILICLQFSCGNDEEINGNQSAQNGGALSNTDLASVRNATDAVSIANNQKPGSWLIYCMVCRIDFNVQATDTWACKGARVLYGQGAQEAHYGCWGYKETVSCQNQKNRVTYFSIIEVKNNDNKAAESKKPLTPTSCKDYSCMITHPCSPDLYKLYFKKKKSMAII